MGNQAHPLIKWLLLWNFKGAILNMIISLTVIIAFIVKRDSWFTSDEKYITSRICIYIVLILFSLRLINSLVRVILYSTGFKSIAMDTAQGVSFGAYVVVFAATAVFVVGLTYVTLNHLSKIQNGVAVDAVIISQRSVSQDSIERTYLSVYRYYVDGEMYETERGDSVFSRRGDVVTVYYNKNNPERITIYSSFYAILLVILSILFPLLLNIPEDY